MRIVLDTITRPKSRTFFGADLTGIELRADDLDWSFGSGTPVSGHAQDLALALCGRRLPAGVLRGEQSRRFAQPPGGAGPADRTAGQAACRPGADPAAGTQQFRLAAALTR